MMTRRAGIDAVEEDKYSTINFEETELRLGLPRAAAGSSSSPNDVTDLHTTFLKNNICTSATGKRGFSVDLKLNLSSNNTHSATSDSELKNTTSTSAHIPVNDSTKPPAAKAQVVGWPPVRSFRKNIVSLQKNNSDETEKANPSTSANTISNRHVAAFVKVSMDGAPYLRKVDLKLYKSYEQLSDVLSKMFSSFTIGKKELMNESKLIDLLNGSDYVPTYEDKDGDWMLMGDVPWEMFVESCKRLRIMKGSEACKWASTKNGGEAQEQKKLNANFDIPTTDYLRQRARLGIGVPRKQTGSTKTDHMIGV